MKLKAWAGDPSSSSLLRLEFSDTTIYDPYMRALPGTAPQLCEGVVLSVEAGA